MMAQALAPEAGVSPPPAAPRLRIDELSVRFHSRQGPVGVLDRVSFEVLAGQTVGLVGESGSGKSVTCLAMLGLLDRSAEVVHGSIRLGSELLASPGQRPVKRRGLAMVFQYPRTALNPIRTVGAQIVDVLETMGRASRKAQRDRALDLLREVQISEPERRFSAYPFELSGGQCQRVLIAMALAREPSVLLADEPTTGLDVVTQKSVLKLIDRARRERGMSTVFVTHDLALAFEFCDVIVVMQKGRIVEQGSSRALLAGARDPYTRALMAATPGISRTLEALRGVLEEAHA
jgi:ABC-type dipeptide/oligopeptide/nickel transport system ATPase component